MLGVESLVDIRLLGHFYQGKLHYRGKNKNVKVELLRNWLSSRSVADIFIASTL
jgi:hypothetical protein